MDVLTDSAEEMSYFRDHVVTGRRKEGNAFRARWTKNPSTGPGTKSHFTDLQPFNNKEWAR